VQRIAINRETLRVDAEGKLVVNLTRGNVACDDVAIADRARRRMRGLLGRDSLAPGEGMLLQPAPSIHTAFMRFTIDAVFVDGTLRVKKIVAGLRPWRIASARRSWGVLELAQGEVAQRGIALGDQLGVVEITDYLGSVEEGAAWQRGSWTSIADVNAVVTGGSNGAKSNGRSSSSDPSGAERGPHVLVVGTDRRFRSVAAALLTRRGCAVTLSDRTREVGDLATREHADVVVLETGLSLTEAARGAAQIQSLPRRVGLVLVGDEVELGLSTLPVLPKWGSFDGLYDAVEHACPDSARELANGRRHA
jgi:uncharacterized protein